MAHKDPVTGQTLNQDGTPRKKRTTKSTREKAADQRAARERYFVSTGKDLFFSIERFGNLKDAVQTHRRYLREGENISTPEGLQMEIERLQARIAMLSDKSEVAKIDVPNRREIVEEVESVFSDIGTFYDEFLSNNDDAEPSEDEVIAYVESVLDSETITAFADTEDPYAIYRRAKTDENEGTEDTLADN